MMRNILVPLLIAFSLLPISNVFSTEEYLSITISSDGKAKIKQVIDTKTIMSNVKIGAISGKISSILATDEKGVLLHTTHRGNIVQIASLGASEVNLSYETKIASKRGEIWKVSYESDKQSLLTLPPLSKIVSISAIPSNINDNTLTMRPGQISVSYVIKEVSENTFIAPVEGKNFQIQVVTASNVDDFDYYFTKFRFEVDERVPILVVLPNSYISDPIDVTLNENRVDFQKLSHNNTHSWIRINPHDKGIVEIEGNLQKPALQEIKISGDTDIILGAAIGMGMLIFALLFRSKIRNNSNQQKSEIYPQIHERRLTVA